MFRQGFEAKAEGVRYKSTNGHQPGPYQYYVFAVSRIVTPITAAIALRRCLTCWSGRNSKGAPFRIYGSL